MARFLSLDKRRVASYTNSVLKFRLSVIFILMAFLGAPFASLAAEATAKIQDILINADSMFRDNEKELVELEGNIQIIYKGQHIRAQKARIRLRVKQIELYGNAEIVGATNTIQGDRVFLDYESNTGVIYNGSVRSGPVVFSGSTLEKVGDSEFIVADADYTACTNCPASWSFGGSSVRAQMGGYAYIKNAIIRFWDVPVLWLPYLVVPLKSERQSGLLTPAFENSSNGGFAFSMPYFWAISRNTDATITLTNYEKRGLKATTEYRYVLDEVSGGDLNFANIHDKAFAEDSRFNDFRTPNDKGKPIDRWFMRYEHFFEMPDEIIHRSQLNLASDLQYSKDFPRETLNYGDSAMENRMSFTKNTKDQHYSVDSSYYVNMLHADPLSGNSDAVHRLPELKFSQAQKNIGSSNFIYSIDLDYTNFTRSGNAYDDLIADKISDTDIRYIKNTCGNDPKWEDKPHCKRIYDGSYDPSIDLLRTGQRLEFIPTVYYPVKIGDGVDIIPKVGFRETHYSFNAGEERNYVRRFIRGEILAKMNFSRIYGDTINTKATRYKHEVVPEVSFTNIPWVQADNHPFFGTGQIDNAPYSPRDSISDGDTGSPYGLQFDYNDRIYDRKRVTLGLVNRLVEKRWIGDRPDYRQIASLKIAQSYDAAQENINKGKPWSDIVTILDVRLDHFQTYSTFNYYPKENLTNTSSRVRVLNKKGHFGQIQVNRNYAITPGQEVNLDSLSETYTLAAGFVSSYLNLMGRFVYDARAEEQSRDKIKSWAYIAQFKPPGECWMITAIQDQITGGDQNFRLNFEFNFDGVVKPPMPPEALDQFGF